MKTPLPYELVPYPGNMTAIVQLPLWPESKRGTPNTFLRSALFSATQGRHRQWMKGEVLASLNGFTVRFTGEQLTQSDLDVWQALTHLVRTQPLGTECNFSAHHLLKTLGRDTGNSQHVWLHNVIIRLTACAVEISFDHKRYFGSLVEAGVADDSTHSYRVRLSPHMLLLFGENQWTQLDWYQRTRLLKQPLAQWLHGFWSSHANPLAISVERLRELCGSNTKQMRNFKIHLTKALDALVEIEFLISYAIDPNNLVCVTRHRHPSLSSPPTP